MVASQPLPASAVIETYVAVLSASRGKRRACCTRLKYSVKNYQDPTKQDEQPMAASSFVHRRARLNRPGFCLAVVALIISDAKQTAADDADFRSFRWGDAERLVIEREKPNETRTYGYEASIAGSLFALNFSFKAGHLSGASYSKSLEWSNQLAAAKPIEALAVWAACQRVGGLLSQKYGEPEERNEYLGPPKKFYSSFMPKSERAADALMSVDAEGLRPVLAGEIAIGRSLTWRETRTSITWLMQAGPPTISLGNSNVDVSCMIMYSPSPTLEQLLQKSETINALRDL